jgi:hypothetical protein
VDGMNEKYWQFVRFFDKYEDANKYAEALRRKSKDLFRVKSRNDKFYVEQDLPHAQ